MTNKSSPHTPSLFLLILLSATVAPAQENVIVSSQVGDCSLTMETNERWNTLRLRAHHPNYRPCHIDRDSFSSVLRAAFSRADPPRLDGPYSSLSIGRLIDYPWLSEYLATTAHRDKGWDARKGKPVAMDINKFVSRLLFARELIAPIEPALAKGGYLVVGITVEKVLVGGFRDIPFYRGAMQSGRVPYDAQVWFRLEKR